MLVSQVWTYFDAGSFLLTRFWYLYAWWWSPLWHWNVAIPT